MDIVEEQLLAYNSRDLERFIATYSTNIVIEDGENNLLVRGYEQMRERYGPMFKENPELQCRIVNRMRIGKFVVDEEEITGRGSPTPVHAVVIYRVEGDKIVHVRILK
jgi:hypothetical protein